MARPRFLARARVNDGGGTACATDATRSSRRWRALGAVRSGCAPALMPGPMRGIGTISSVRVSGQPGDSLRVRCRVRSGHACADYMRTRRGDYTPSAYSSAISAISHEGLKKRRPNGRNVERLRWVLGLGRDLPIPSTVERPDGGQCWGV